MSTLAGLGQPLGAFLGVQERSGEDETRRKVRPRAHVRRNGEGAGNSSEELLPPRPAGQ